jgi:hypothetical protein
MQEWSAQLFYAPLLAFISRYQVGGRRHCAYSKRGNDCAQLFPRTYLPTAPDIIHNQHGQHSLVLPPVTNSKSTKLSIYLNRQTEFLSNKSYETRLRSRLYPSASSSLCYVSLVAWQICPSVHTRLPLPENHLGELQIQPYIHNCAVTIHEGRRVHLLHGILQASLSLTGKSLPHNHGPRCRHNYSRRCCCYVSGIKGNISESA